MCISYAYTARPFSYSLHVWKKIYFLAIAKKNTTMQDFVTLQNYTNESTNSKEARDLRA